MLHLSTTSYCDKFSQWFPVMYFISVTYSRMVGVTHLKFGPGALALSNNWPGLDRSLMLPAASASRQTKKGNHLLLL